MLYDSIDVVAGDPEYVRRRDRLWKITVRRHPLTYDLMYELALRKNPGYYGVVIRRKWGEGVDDDIEE